ncbi:nuclear transport factor 2-like isoform X2 [Macadamia integrifolia]|uniref:nuclear transport factor 2-like isoform X2 n=1 Tax=Macadamia integrifolia TaxID=60698 RepID=UPI001C4ED545|nr:nuclear transport factor 2-like isoform X2 [Macadamia integrifolia]
MATPASSPPPSAQVVGNAFVEQYYHILHQSPELVYRFYQDSSVLSRPDSNGKMTSVATMQAINDKILSLDYKEFKAEIKTVDAQDSYKDGVTVLVTGWLTGKDNVRRKFTQSFFLAPQDKGYFVLNDIFRYADENEPLESNPVSVNVVCESTPVAPFTSDPEPAHIPDRPVLDPATSPTEENLNNGEEVCDPSDNDDGSVIEEEVPMEPQAQLSQNEAHPVAESSASTVQEDAPKKSYASIVKVMKGNTAPTPVYVPTNTVRAAAPANTEHHSLASTVPASAPETSAPSVNNAPESSSAQEDVEGHSIYVRGLPLNATAVQLEEEFKKFGPIKPGGIQVRSNKQFCFGFVEFELQSSMKSAIQAASVTIGGRQAYIEEKRTTTRVVGSGRGVRFPPGRGGGGFRNDNFRGRGNFGGNRGYGRNEFGNRGEYSGRGRGPGRSGDNYQRVDENANGRVGRQGGQTAITA